MKQKIKEILQEYWPYTLIACGIVIGYYAFLVGVVGYSLR